MDCGLTPDLAQRLAQWHDGLGELAFTSAFATPDGGADHVRALTGLLASHPQQVFAADTARVAALLDAGADGSAALILVERLAGYMLSCAPGGRHMATVILAGQSQEYHAEGASAALALVGALATALAGPCGNSPGEGLRRSNRPELRVN